MKRLAGKRIEEKNNPHNWYSILVRGKYPEPRPVRSLMALSSPHSLAVLIHRHHRLVLKLQKTKTSKPVRMDLLTLPDHPHPRRGDAVIFRICKRRLLDHPDPRRGNSFVHIDSPTHQSTLRDSDVQFALQRRDLLGKGCNTWAKVKKAASNRSFSMSSKKSLLLTSFYMIES